MTNPRARCDYTGCHRYARPNTTRCTTHRNQVDHKGNPPSDLEQKLAANNYGKYTPRVLQMAANHADTEGVDTEISILRATVMDVLENETDPSRRAAAVAKLSSIIIQAMRAKRALSGETADQFTSAVAVILEELNQ